MDELRGNARDYQRKLEELFRAADTDENGTLSATEFVEAMSLPSVQHYLQAGERHDWLCPKASREGERERGREREREREREKEREREREREGEGERERAEGGN